MPSGAHLPVAGLHAGADHHQSADRARHRALEQEEAALGVGLHHLEVQHRDPDVAHLAGHPGPAEHPGGGGARADGPGAPVLALRSVGCGEAAEAVPLHRPGEPLSARDPDHVGPLARLEDSGRDLLPRLERLVGAELHQVAARLVDPRPGEVAAGRLAWSFPDAIRQLDRGVAVALGRLDLDHPARPGLDHGDGHGPSLIREHLGHAQLLPKDPLGSHQSLISMSTPAARFSRWSSCTVFEVASWMSISRLWVSIWKCSRLSLSLWGDRITV